MNLTKQIKQNQRQNLAAITKVLDRDRIAKREKTQKEIAIRTEKEKKRVKKLRD